eukprot:Pompholyxophrys_punicea_v1_NODE_186_length_2908_cov_28.244304.p3 type:complete len:109 gc:universal NODE_186_length_2908_cov_28.244304:1719-1393(-)
MAVSSNWLISRSSFTNWTSIGRQKVEAPGVGFFQMMSSPYFKTSGTNEVENNALSCIGGAGSESYPFSMGSKSSHARKSPSKLSGEKNCGNGSKGGSATTLWFSSLKC